MLLLILLFTVKNIDEIDFSNLEDLANNYSWITNILHLIMILFYSNLIIIYVFQLHVIFFRNMPTKQKVLSATSSAVKLIIPATIIAIPFIDAVDSTVWTRPNWVTQQYSKVTRGYCPSSLAVKNKLDVLRGHKLFLQHEELFKSTLNNKTATIDDINDLINQKPKLYSNLSMAEKIRFNSL